MDGGGGGGEGREPACVQEATCQPQPSLALGVKCRVIPQPPPPNPPTPPPPRACFLASSLQGCSPELDLTLRGKLKEGAASPLSDPFSLSVLAASGTRREPLARAFPTGLRLRGLWVRTLWSPNPHVPFT